MSIVLSMLKSRYYKLYMNSLRKPLFKKKIKNKIKLWTILCYELNHWNKSSLERKEWQEETGILSQVLKM